MVTKRTKTTVTAVAAKKPSKSSKKAGAIKTATKSVKKAVKIAVKKVVAKVSKVTAIPYVIKDEWLQVTYLGEPFALQKSHPTFAKLKKALQSKRWSQVPKLISLARSLQFATGGDVTVKEGTVYYKGRVVDNGISHFITRLVQEGKKIEPILRFMSKLYRNPEPKAIEGFFTWWRKANLPITDDGDFICYKSVDSNLKDQHTHKIDNSPGQVIWMPRKAADTDWRTECSYGFHVCSKQYGLIGTRHLAVKVSPRDVISCPSSEAGKIRVLRYEVIRELGAMNSDSFKEEGYSELEGQVLVEIKAERKELLSLLLADKAVKRNIRAGKLSKATLQKAAYARLKTFAQRYGVVASNPAEKAVTEAPKPLQAARKAAGLTVGQLAKALGKGYKTVAVLEAKEYDQLTQDSIDSYLDAIAKLVKLGSLSTSAITFPHAVRAVN